MPMQNTGYGGMNGGLGVQPTGFGGMPPQMTGMY